MKFYKRQNTDQIDPMSSRWAIETDGRIITNSTNSMETPLGTKDERPTVPVAGSIRFNTDIGAAGELEVYVNNQWEIIKTNRHATVTKQVFDNGDYADTIFGPLAYDIDPNKPENLTLYVENVWQIPGVNYELRTSTLAEPLTTSTFVTADTGFGETVVPLDNIADFNVGVTLSGGNLEGVVIVATSATDKTITVFPGTLGFIRAGGQAVAVYPPGTYVKFYENATPVPMKPVIALLGLDGYCPPFEV